VEGSGWTSLVVLILVFGGVQLLSLGIVSEYVGRTYEEVKRRPRYVIESLSGIERP
jgi:dolichol-phosphate mannosyltransferase